MGSRKPLPFPLRREHALDPRVHARRSEDLRRHGSLTGRGSAGQVTSSVASWRRLASFAPSRSKLPWRVFGEGLSLARAWPALLSKAYARENLLTGVGRFS